METMVGWLMEMAAGNPNLAGLFMVMGFLRVINKPLFSLIEAVVKETETQEDDKWWSKIKQSKGMKSVLWLLDFTASVKIKA